MGARAQQDYGFFGPDSVTWKVWGYPTSIVLGFLRAVVIEELDPHLVASVDQSGQVKQRPKLRYDRTMQYFATIKFGDAESVLRASDTLMKIHSRAVGHDPVTGGRLRRQRPGLAAVDPPHRLALDPLHLRDLRPGEALRGRGGAVLGGVRAGRRVPDDRPGRRPPQPRGHPRLLRGVPPAAGRLRGRAGHDGLPARREHDRPARAHARRAARAVQRRRPPRRRSPPCRGGCASSAPPRSRDSPTASRSRSPAPSCGRSPSSTWIQLWALRLASPRTAPIIEPVLRGTPPVHPVVREPAEARAQYGVTDPRVQYAGDPGRTRTTGRPGAVPEAPPRGPAALPRLTLPPSGSPGPRLPGNPTTPRAAVRRAGGGARRANWWAPAAPATAAVPSRPYQSASVGRRRRRWNRRPLPRATHRGGGAGR